MNIGSITLGDETYDDVTVEFGRYVMSTGAKSPAIMLWADDEPLTTATVNVGAPGIFIKDYSENEGLLAQLEEKGLVKRTGRTHHSGFVDIPEVVLTGAFAEVTL